MYVFICTIYQPIELGTSLQIKTKTWSLPSLPFLTALTVRLLEISLMLMHASAPCSSHLSNDFVPFLLEFIRRALAMLSPSQQRIANFFKALACTLIGLILLILSISFKYLNVISSKFWKLSELLPVC